MQVVQGWFVGGCQLPFACSDRTWPGTRSWWQHPRCHPDTPHSENSSSGTLESVSSLFIDSLPGFNAQQLVVPPASGRGAAATMRRVGSGLGAVIPGVVLGGR